MINGISDLLTRRSRLAIKLLIATVLILLSTLFGLVGCTYKIESYEDWMALADGGTASIYDKVSLESDIDFAGREFHTADLSGMPLDGNGHALKNISYTSATSNFVLLTDCDRTVANLVIENIYLDIQTEGANVSVFRDMVDSFENVTITGTINAPNAESVGGFAFQYSNPAAGKVFKNCISDLTINGGDTAGGFLAFARTAAFESCENKSDVTAKIAAGGFVGASREDYENDRYVASREIKLTSCSNSGVITSNGTAAGLVGTGEKCVITDCRNDGEINGVCGVAGLVGSLMGEVSNSVNNAKITVIAPASDNIANVGGIVGVLNGKSNVSSCTNNGEISNPFYISGGIVGSCNGNVDGCVNNGIVTGTASVGGIIGFVGDEFDPWTISITTLKVSNCTNNADVRGKLFCGGIVGMADLNKFDNATYDASEYITEYVQMGFTAIEFGYKVTNNLIFGEDVSMKRFTDQEITDFINSILKLFTRATRLQLSGCNSTGKVCATNFAGGYVGVMFSCMVESEEFGTNSFTGVLDCEGVKTDGCTYVNAVDIEGLK